MRGELETEQNCNILTPTLMAITAFLFRSLGLFNRGPGGQASLRHGPHSSIFSSTDLNFLSPGLYNNSTYTYFQRASQFRTQFNPSTVKVAPDLLISSTGCTCYLHRCISSFDSLAGSEVNMQHSYLPTEGISSKVNVIARMEFELAYFKAGVQHFSHCATKLSSYL